ncbi:RyR domain-containing protein [Actinoplanes sp. NPDC049599]|uniref:RyR domain-containing protein n=1 Tax=Actinoplanes sp. NPDC049599 TaxID=3363903 RepID=UPI00379D8B15
MRRAVIPAVLIIVSLALGYWGLSDYLIGERAVRFGRSPLDLTYYNLQLFMLDPAPIGEGGPLPMPLQIARFLAPAVTVYAAVEGIRTWSADRWQRRRLRRLRGHAIVTGDTPTARSLAAALRESGTEVVRQAHPTAEGLAGAGIRGARVLYACADDTHDCAINVATAYAAANARGPGSGLTVYAQVSDPVLGTALRARQLAVGSGADLPVTIFNPEHLAARAVVCRDPVPAGPVVVVGLGAFGRQVVVELARSWGRGGKPGRIPVTLVGPDAAEAVAELDRAWPVVHEYGAPAAVTTLSEVAVVPHRVYLCHPDEESALRTALSAVALWSGPRHSVVVRLDHIAGQAAALRAGRSRLLDDLGGRLSFVSVGELAGRSAGLGEDLPEQLARGIHDRYLRDQAGKGEPLRSRSGLVPWEELPDTYRAANRDQAGRIGAELEAIGSTIAPWTAEAPTFRYTADEVDRLAEQEHELWSRQRRAGGWTYGPVRENAAKRHPSLVPWPALGELERDKDRDAVRRLPDLLRDVGLTIVRLGPEAGESIVVDAGHRGRADRDGPASRFPSGSDRTR